ncbi:AraC family transcriptional regulator [Pseudomaricurvus alkylphenolicus]|jgi:AraC-like DNA-binding protein|uniref:AraC family transcriptional regulator n=1 Tax=Pseudomaricurvus alkylphenolicus TaxID=1306991 RepID=UPI0014234F43|nr:helix-turn-helix domain-containing protein [Pseudomaricurvus alkylphenolicus]NIB38502.1 AraC family transcriptional regulator [Pseudomaricurvus alkylphenolicus]
MHTKNSPPPNPLARFALKLDSDITELLGLRSDQLPVSSYCLYQGNRFEEAGKSTGKLTEARVFEALDEKEASKAHIQIHRAHFSYSQIGVSFCNIASRLFTVNDAKQFNLVIPLLGSAEFHSPKGVTTAECGEAMLCSPYQQFDFRRSPIHAFLIASISVAGWEHFLGEEILQEDGSYKPFVRKVNIADERFRTVTGILGLLCHELEFSRTNNFRQDMVISRLEEALWLSIFDAFEEHTDRNDTLAPALGMPAHVKRAVDFIREQAHREIHLKELLQVANTSSRSLQTGFRDCFSMSPMAYVKKVKLGQVRHALLAPENRDRYVADIAADWGFFHLGNFAKYYRQEFGELPSETQKRIA